MTSAYLVDGLRSPMGKYGGALAPLRATELASMVVAALFERLGVSASQVDRVIAGMVLQDMTESNPARIVALRVGIPQEIPAFTVNMQCASGMLAAILAAQQVILGECSVVLAIGLESMSNAPHMVAGTRWGLKSGHAEFTDSLKECTLAGSKMWGDPWYMIEVAEHHAKVDGISRQEMDEYAVISHQRAAAAWGQGLLADEIVPITVPGRDQAILEVDEHVRPNTTVEALAKLPAVKPGGRITAGNASGMNDGAAAALITNEDGLRRLGIDPLARFVMPGTAMVGCDPTLMGYSAVDAVNSALDAAGMGPEDMDLIECNEGFAVQLLADQRLGKWSSERVNVDGGSLGLGHPVGMSGLRIVHHLARSLHQRDLDHGVATVPAGSGLGTAVILERARH